MAHTGVSKFFTFCLLNLISFQFISGQTSAPYFTGNLNKTIKAILVNGDLLESFRPDRNTFYVNLPYTTRTSPWITVLKSQPGSFVKIYPASNLFGSEEERTARILVSSEDKSYTENFKLVFNVLPKLDLFLLIGHLNPAARTNMTSDYLEIVRNVYLLTPSGRMEPAASPLNRYSNAGSGHMTQPVDPEYIFSKKIVEQTGTQIGLIVNTSPKNSVDSWRAGSSDQYYEKTLRRTIPALKWGTLKAIIWNHTADETLSYDTYLTKLSSVIAALRRDLGYPQVLFIAGETPCAFTKQKNAFNDNYIYNPLKQRMPNMIIISGDDLAPLIPANDSIAYNTIPWIMGERYAESVLKFCY